MRPVAVGVRSSRVARMREMSATQLRPSIRRDPGGRPPRALADAVGA